MSIEFPGAASRFSTRRSRTAAGLALITIGVLGCGEDARPAPPAQTPLADARRVTARPFVPLEDAGPSPTATDAGDPAARATRSSEIYHGECVAPGVVQWGFFTYVASTPDDSRVLFRARSAASLGALESARFIELITASRALGTTRCSFTGPAPCPIDMYDVLGGPPLAHHPFSEVEITLTPSAGGAMPTVDEWTLNYSCTFNQ